MKPMGNQFYMKSICCEYRALDDWHKMVSEAKLTRDQKKQLQSLVQNRFQVRDFCLHRMLS